MSNVARVIDSLDQTISSFKSKVDVKVNEVNVSTAHIQSVTDKIYNNINRFKSEMVHGEEKQIAHENMLRIEQLLKEQFGNHAAIRRTIMGIVKDFDLNLVRNNTIQELSEELWITSSRYWLSYALLAITAWVNDYPEIARNALAESGRRDPVKATLFFCLMNLRFGRSDAAKQWFNEYIGTLSPAKLQQETSILLQAFLHGIFGKDKELESRIAGLIGQWVTQINENEQFSDELLQAYESYIELLPVDQPFTYKAISAYCTDAASLRRIHADVSKYNHLLSFIKSFEGQIEPQQESNYKKRVDGILMDLISNHDAEERELRLQQTYYKFIIENNGDVEQAKQRYQALDELQHEHFNIGKQMLAWALHGDDTQTDAQVRKFGFQHTKGWFKKAVEHFDTDLHTAFPGTYNLQIDTWEAVSTGKDQNELSESMSNHFENEKFQNKYINTLNITAAMLAAASMALAFVSVWSLAATGICAGFLAYRAMDANKKYPLRVQAALDQLAATMDEIADFEHYYEENRNKKHELLSAVKFL